ncbi:MAG: hypothetical protein ACYTXF_35345 [Nostoc sp.]
MSRLCSMVGRDRHGTEKLELLAVIQILFFLLTIHLFEYHNRLVNHPNKYFKR